MLNFASFQFGKKKYFQNLNNGPTWPWWWSSGQHTRRLLQLINNIDGVCPFLNNGLTFLYSLYSQFHDKTGILYLKPEQLRFIAQSGLEPGAVGLYDVQTDPLDCGGPIVKQNF